MESKLKNQKVTEEKAETSKSKLLEERKAQAKELAALRDAHFSIDEELSNIYDMLVNDDAEVETPEESKIDEPIDLDIPKPKPLTKAQIEAQAAREKAKLEKEKEREKLRLQKQKEKEREKLRLQKQKEKEREKLRLQKQKEKEREKLRLQKQKEKEKEKLRLQKEKEKEKLRLQKEKQGTIKKTTTSAKRTGQSTTRKTTPKVSQKTDENILTKTNEGKATIEAMSEDKKTDMQENKINSSNDNLVGSDVEAKKFFDNIKPSTVVGNILERPKEKAESGIIDNLQRLKEQIMAQKNLERELMELEAKNVQKKELTLKSKLTELESLAREEEELDRQDILLEQLENEKLLLAEELRTEKDKVNRLLSLKYSDINVINPDKLSLSQEFLDSFTAISAEDLYTELEAVQNELTELREIHELNRRSILERSSKKEETTLNSERYIEIFNKLRGDVEKYKERSNELEQELAEANKIKNQMMYAEQERVDKAIIKKQNELDIKYLNKEASLISEYEIKLDEIRESLKTKLTENINKAKLGLEAKYRNKLRDQNALLREFKKLTDKLAESTQLVGKLQYDLQIAENDVTSKAEQIEYFQTRLQEIEDNKADDNIVSDLQNRIVILENKLSSKASEVNDLSNQLTLKTGEVEKLQMELSELEKLNSEKLSQGYDNQISQFETQIETLNNEITSLNAKIEELNKYNTNLNNVYLDQQDEMTKIIEERNNLYNEISNKNKIINDKNNELTLLQAQSSNELHGHSQEFLKQIDNLKDENNNKNREIEQLLKHLDELKQSEIENQKLFSDNNHQVQELKSELENLNTNYHKLQDQLNLTSTNLIQANANLAKAIEERDGLTRQLQNITNDYMQSEVEIAKMANELDIIKENLHDPEKDKFRKVNEELYNLQAKLTTIKSSYEQQTANLQEQVNELTSLLSTQELQLNDKVNEVLELKNVIQGIEESQVEPVIKDEEKDANQINDQIQKLVDAYTKEKDLLAYTHNNNLNKLEVEKKFASSKIDSEAIDRQINNLISRYQETIARNNNKFQASIQALLQGDEVIETPVKPIEVSKQEIVLEKYEEEFEEEVQEIEEDNLEIEDIEAIDGVDAPVDAPLETVVAKSHEIKTAEEKEPYQQSQFIGIVDKEYLDRLNNIHRMKRNLETKKKEYLNDYDNVSVNTDANQEAMKMKIAEVKAKINLLEQQYRQTKGYHPDREREYENSKTKLYLELEGRQEKLRKLQEEETRIHGLKYKNLIKNIDEQLQILDKEEMQLKEYYLNKQNKLQSKINRENEILEKLQAEKATPAKEEGRLIESQEEIKQRILSKQNLSPDSYEDYQVEFKDELDALEEEFAYESVPKVEINYEEAFEATDEQIELEDAVTEEVEDTMTEIEPEEPGKAVEVEAVTPVEQTINHEKLSSINTKEQELRSLYAKYANAEAVLVRENKFVREYKNTRNEVLAYNSENNRINESIEELTGSLNNATSEQARSIRDKIKEYEVRKKLIAKRVSYLDKQLINMESNSFVQEYRKVVEKLDSMEDILQKYHEVKQNLR